MWLFYYFRFERNYDVLKSKSPRILLNKNVNFNKNKNETESKMENPTQSFRETNIVFISSYKNRKLKVKLMSCCLRKKKGDFFVPFILSERNLFKICTLSQCIVY